MAYKNRYVFIKRTYPNTIILFKNQNKYVGYNEQEQLLKFINFKKLKDLNKLKINYIIINNMDIVKYLKFKKNKYQLYYKRFSLSKLINLIFDNKKKF